MSDVIPFPKSDIQELIGGPYPDDLIQEMLKAAQNIEGGADVPAVLGRLIFDAEQQDYREGDWIDALMKLLSATGLSVSGRLP